jgi:methylthioribulose-1-phosphate dehydratase
VESLHESRIRRLDVVLAARRMAADAAWFAQRGWLLGTCGNLSCLLSREPFEILVTLSGRDKSSLTLEDFALVGRGCQPLSAGQPSSETLVHEVLYDRTPARAVYHVHTLANNLMSRLCFEQGQVTLQGVEMIKGLEGHSLTDTVRLPIVPNSEDSKALAEQIRQHLSPTVPGILVYQHGLYAWGRTPEDARRHTEVLEFLLEYALRLRQMGLED